MIIFGTIVGESVPQVRLTHLLVKAVELVQDITKS